ncbi:MAG TPA: VWA domain-containing protein [Thermoanaerobaculia bacterium]|nr:VWA domain-containing protein [Thermoanaerobaculia bacterium]
MKLRIFAVALLTALGGAALHTQTPPESTFGEAVEVNVVNVDVYVTDKSGQRITGLAKTDFELLEDGKPVAITNFEVVTGRAAGAEAAPAPVPAPGAPAARAPEDALNLVVLFDNSNMKPAGRNRAARQLREFLTRNLSPGDRVMLVAQGLGLKVLLPFSSDPAAMEQALTEIERLAAQGVQSDQDRRLAFQTIMTIQETSVQPPDPVPCPLVIASPAHTYASSRRNEVLRALGSLTVLVNSLSGVPGRKALLHVSDGLPLIPGQEAFELLIGMCGGGGTAGLGTSISAGDGAGGSPDIPAQGRGRQGTAPGFDPNTVYDSTLLGPNSYQAATQGPVDAQAYNIIKDLRKLAAHANAHRVTLYTLQASGLQPPDGSDAGLGSGDRIFQFPAMGAALRANNRESLQFLADETGGRSILDTNDFRQDLTRMREDFDSYYSLGFTPSHTGDGREHRIEVKLKRPGARLRYRQSYRDKPPMEKLVDRTLAALYHGFDDNPLEIQMEIGELAPGTAGLWTVPVQLKIPLFKLAILNRDDVYEGSLKLFLVTGTPDGANSPVRQVNVPLRIPRKEVLHAMGKFYIYNLTLNMKPGEHRFALAVRDEVAATTSYLSRAVSVGATAEARP